MSKDNGGQAFPGEQSPDLEAIKILRDTTGIGIHEAKNMLSKQGGMTLRDWFAGQALTHAFPSGFPAYPDHKRAAREAYNLADAMLAARKC